MSTPDPIETILARLLPSALSDLGQLGIDNMLDELAHANVVPIPTHGWRTRSWIGSGIAAAIVALGILLTLVSNPSKLQIHPNLSPIPQPGWILVSESKRIESSTDEGWQESSDGSTMHTLSLNVIEQNEVRDQETGMLVQISDPHEELILMPISTF